jgi:hypothetical protein
MDEKKWREREDEKVLEFLKRKREKENAKYDKRHRDDSK